ncbi:DEAD/DEAH box helicase family protein, partial [Planctomycetaceae bacterium]|nr:DEAD/DEAH box helicase family protein [Planctomycetaceae bacterium]
MKSKSHHSGTFSFIEQKIRQDADGTEFGFDFEWLCKWYLQHAPEYQHTLEQVWLWKEWPDRWTEDERGIDIVARTRDGQLWAIQAKAWAPDRSLTLKDISSFLSESNRAVFSYRLLMATTDNLTRNAQIAIDGQEKSIGCLMRGDLITADLEWPTQIGESTPPSPQWTPRLHQRKAIEAVLQGFNNHDRGRLIMACGTGKTLTGMWIAERLETHSTLILVPSLSLVAQNLAEWCRHSSHNFDYLVICSDKTVVKKGQDSAISSTTELGIPVTTDVDEIRQFMTTQHDDRPTVIFATYQSSDR